MMIKSDIKEFRIFENFRPEELDSVLKAGEEVTFQAGQVIMEEAAEDPAPDLYVILEGRVKVQVRKIQIDLVVEQKRLAVLKKGDIFGEMGLLKGRHRSAGVTAYGDVTVLKINREKLFALFAENSRQGYIFMRNLAAILSDRMVDLIFMWRDEL